MTWTIVRNPAWSDEQFEKAKRGEIRPACHDRSPSIDIHCSCLSTMHLHRTQLDGVPAGATIAMKCHGCDKALELDRDRLIEALREIDPEVA